jgi:integrase
VPSLEKQPNGRWRARYRDLNGRSRSQTFDRRVDAQRFLEVNGADMARGEWVDPLARRARFEEWAASWEESLVRVAPTTARRYRQILIVHVLPHFGGRRITSIDYQDVESFIAAQFAKGLSPKSVRESVSVVSLILRAALRARVLRDNPAAGHAIRVRHQAGQALALDDLLRLVEHTRPPYRAAVLLLVHTGMRPAEMAGLRVGRLDLTRRQVTVAETLTDVGGRLVPGPTKSDRQRVVPLPAVVVDALAGYLAARRAELGRALEPDDYVFTALRGGPLNTRKFRALVIRPALVAAGLPESFRTYDLRHSHASELIDMGASALAVKERLGHTDISTTLRNYGHLFPGTGERLAAELDARHRAAMARRPAGEVVAFDDQRRGSGEDRDTRRTRADGRRR